MSKKQQEQNIENNTSKNNNVLWIGWNSFFTDMSSEMIKPLLPIYLKVILQVPVWVITLFNTLSDFLANIFKIIFWLKADKVKNKKKLILIWYSISNLFKPFMFIIQSVYWLFFIELLNRIGKWIRSAPKEVLMTYSIKENELWKWFWFQKAMDSFWAFVWTILISLLLYIFWLEYQVSLGWLTFNLFYIIMFLTLIPWIISYLIIVKKVRNVYIDKWYAKEVEEKKKKKLLFDFSKIFDLGEGFNYLMWFIVLLSIWNIALVFYILELIKLDFQPYQITLFYSIYVLVDALLSYGIGKLSDKKGTSKYILWFSLLAIFFSLLLTYTIGISHDFYWIITGIIIFALLWLYEAWFEWTFKKVIVSNINKEYTWTAIWMYLGVSWIIKILASLLFAFAWEQWKTESVFWFWFLFITMAIIYLFTIVKYKKIKV